MATLTAENDYTEKIERNLDLLFFKEQLRLVVRSNRSRTNTWRKDGNREKEKHCLKNDDSRFKIHRYKWDQATVVELPTIPEDRSHQIRPRRTRPRVTKSQPSSQQESKLPRLCMTAGGKLETPCFTAQTHRYTYKAWELDRCERNKERNVMCPHQFVEPSAAPDIPMSLFKEFVCAYNPISQTKRKEQVFITLDRS